MTYLLYLILGFVVAITDFMAKQMTVKSKLREWFTFLVSVLSFLAGLSMVTQGGLYMFNLWDNYAATGLALFWFCFWECIALSWGYGAEHIYDHIEDILGRKINGWLKFCWKFITPFVILVCMNAIFMKTFFFLHMMQKILSKISCFLTHSCKKITLYTEILT